MSVHHTYTLLVLCPLVYSVWSQAPAGLTKREASNTLEGSDEYSYGYGMAKRAADSGEFAYGLAKRAADSGEFAYGLAKRAADSGEFAYGLAKRAADSGEFAYGLVRGDPAGLVKRAAQALDGYGGGGTGSGYGAPPDGLVKRQIRLDLVKRESLRVKRDPPERRRYGQGLKKRGSLRVKRDPPGKRYGQG